MSRYSHYCQFVISDKICNSFLLSSLKCARISGFHLEVKSEVGPKIFSQEDRLNNGTMCLNPIFQSHFGVPSPPKPYIISTGLKPVLHMQRIPEGQRAMKEGQRILFHLGSFFGFYFLLSTVISSQGFFARF